MSSRSKSEVSEENFTILIMLRAKKEETANLSVRVLPQVRALGHAINGTPHGDEAVYFNTTNEYRVQTTCMPIIVIDDVFLYLKGRFFLISEGQIYKIRILLPKPTI